MAASFTELLERFEPIGLEALDARAALQRRVDQKYLIPPDALAPLLERLRPAFLALEIDGRRESVYESVYFDTPGLRCYRDHVEGQAPRIKVRTRLYVDTRVCALEAKLKRADGETAKASCDLDASDHGRLTAEATGAATLRHRPRGPAARHARRRAVTGSAVPGGALAELAPGHVIVETKSEDGDSEADALLREDGHEPVSLSKYRRGIEELV